MNIVYAKAPFPESWISSIFLAGPTPRDTETPSWRPEALRLLSEAGYQGAVFVPEVEDGEWKSGPDAYLEQVEWEEKGLNLADVILFWVPRDMEKMPALTTNVEFGRWVTSGKCVLGAPPEAKSVKYLKWMLHEDAGGEMKTSLKEAVQASLVRINSLAGSETFSKEEGWRGNLRSGGERQVPLHIWMTQSFQNWYTSQVQAGNRLDEAKLLWHFAMPKAKKVFSWVLWVKIWISKEDRYKENEWVFSRSDISTVVLYKYPGPSSIDEISDTEIILVREFRSPARTLDGFVRELPGGSSLKPGRDPLEVASSEVEEETGLSIQSSRFVSLGSRQLAATLSSHHAHVFCAEVTEEEMKQARGLADSQAVLGVEEDSERTYVEVTTVRALLESSSIDWSTLGMITKALLGGPVTPTAR